MIRWITSCPASTPSRPAPPSPLAARPFTTTACPRWRRRGFPGVERLPFSLKILLENLLRREDDAFVKADDIRALAGVGSARRPARRRSPSCRRGCCCRTSPACRAWSTWPRCATASPRSAAIPDKVNPLQPVELVIDHSVQVDHFGTAERAGAERRPRVPPQPRALRVPALGPDRVPQLPRRAARDRHRAPGEHRVPGPRGLPRRAGRRRRGVSRHRASAPTRTRRWSTASAWWLGRRRHRGRGGDARPAELDADSAGRSATGCRARCPRAPPPPTSC